MAESDHLAQEAVDQVVNRAEARGRALGKHVDHRFTSFHIVSQLAKG